jgi:hypothetical protein
VNKDEIIQIAKEAGFVRTKMHGALERFANLVAAAERAKLSEPTIDGCPLYSGLPQRKWEGLTEDDAIELLPNVGYEYEIDVQVILAFAHSIEEKLKEKNAEK